MACFVLEDLLFASEECHYSIHKFAAFLGLGEQNVVSVKTDKVGQIIPESLEDKIQQKINDGSIPFMVVATLGTTVRGAFDPIDDIADICKKYDLWLHIDAAWGGGSTTTMFHIASKGQRNLAQVLLQRRRVPFPERQTL
nr:unnamed protein product [Callosobruchus analis]